MAKKIRKARGIRIADETDGDLSAIHVASVLPPPPGAVPVAAAVNPDWLQDEVARQPTRSRQRRAHLPRVAGDRVRLLGALSSRQMKDLAAEVGVSPQRWSELLNGGPVTGEVLTALERSVKEMATTVEDTAFGASMKTSALRTPFAVRSKSLASGSAVAAGPLAADGERSEPLARRGLDRVKGCSRAIRGSVLDLIGEFSPAEELGRQAKGHAPTRWPVLQVLADGHVVTVFAQVSRYMFGKKHPKGPRFHEVIELVTADGAVVAVLESKPYRPTCRLHRRNPPRCGRCSLPKAHRYGCAACRREFNRVTLDCAACKDAAAAAPRFWFDITGAAWQRRLGAAILLRVVTRFASIEDIAFTELHLFVDMERRAPTLLAVRRRLDARKRCLALFAQDDALTGIEIQRRSSRGVQIGIYGRDAKQRRTGEGYRPPEVQGWRAWTRVEIRVTRHAAARSRFLAMMDEAIAHFHSLAWVDLDDVVAEGFEAFWLWLAYWNGPPMSLPTPGRAFGRIAEVNRAAEKSIRRHAEEHLPLHKRKHWSDRGLRKEAIGSDGMDAGLLIQNALNFNAGRASHRPRADECALRIVRDDFHPTLLRVAERHADLQRQLDKNFAATREEWHQLLAPLPKQPTEPVQLLVSFETPDSDEDEGADP